jgi:hypothetical protein
MPSPRWEGFPLSLAAGEYSFDVLGASGGPDKDGAWACPLDKIFAAREPAHSRQLNIAYGSREARAASTPRKKLFSWGIKVAVAESRSCLSFISNRRHSMTTTFLPSNISQSTKSVF